ncbi:MAG: hypothetical protein A2Y20_03940 [Firmicutes bacterium GWF2_51_9]|nr:MAG: hypothetical protein A2Y20_03940 [Firmicutes bacterium GWF2_51_9]OGS58687.1 MAG: hypothetical protein A2Y19_03930 [Firmicutes bacterium GWE2_51_13]HAM62983.1 FAD-binding protein [Erysipelotrichaceae bacterium]HBZ40454.1 FAD-binding protein [Erysipelotrichaceae bacterium]
MYDIVIIGSGPSGAHCAKRLSKNKNLKILLLDRRPMDPTSKIIKSCGGLISSHAQDALRKEGMVLPESIKVDPQFHYVKTYDLKYNLLRGYRRDYINIDRLLFEKWLIDMIPDSVERRFSTHVLSIEETTSHFRIQLKSNDTTEWIESSYLIGADGARSILRSTFFPHIPSPKPYIAIQEVYPTTRNHPAYYGMFDPSITDYYAWLIQKKDRIILGAALETGNETNEKFQSLKEKVEKHCDIRLGTPIHREGAFIARPLRFSHLFFGKGKISLIGEASGSISPTSSEGYSYALNTAKLLCDSIEKHGLTSLATSSYDRSAWIIRLSILGKWLKSPGMYVSWIRSLVMKSGFTAIPLPKEK